MVEATAGCVVPAAVFGPDLGGDGGHVRRVEAAAVHIVADLKNWRILTKVRMNARHATTLLRALLVLTNDEHGSQPLTADQPPVITSLTSTSTPSTTHTNPATCNFRLKSSHSARWWK